MVEMGALRFTLHYTIVHRSRCIGSAYHSQCIVVGVAGQWTVVSGLWSVYCGQRTVVSECITVDVSGQGKNLIGRCRQT